MRGILRRLLAHHRGDAGAHARDEGRFAGVTPEQGGALIAAYAESLVGLPYVHQARAPGIGLDCLGLVIAVGEAHGLIPPDVARADYDYDVDGSGIPEAMAQVADLVSLADAAAGDVMVFRMRGPGHPPQHFGLLTRCPFTGAPLGGFVHAAQRADPARSRVTHEPLSRAWRERLDSVWRYRWPTYS